MGSTRKSAGSRAGNFAGFVIKGMKADQDSKLVYILAILQLPTRQLRRIVLVSGILPGISYRRRSASKKRLRTSSGGRARANLTRCIFPTIAHQSRSFTSLPIPNPCPQTSFLRPFFFNSKRPFQIYPKSRPPSNIPPPLSHHISFSPT